MWTRLFVKFVFFFFSQMMAEFFATTQAQDGFFLNLSTLLLKICQPFMDPCSPKLLKINPQYCAVNVGVEEIAQEDTGLHVVGLDGETRLVVPPDEGQTLYASKAFISISVSDPWP